MQITDEWKATCGNLIMPHERNLDRECNTGKFSQLWKARRGFRIIRQNLRTLEIERHKATRSNTMKWVTIGFYKNKQEMQAAFDEMLIDEYTITEDCTQTYFK